MDPVLHPAGVREEAAATPPAGRAGLAALPPVPGGGVAVTVHGNGSSRLFLRNRLMAAVLHVAGPATLLFDLLMEREAP